jgi:hypothetical protein
VSEQNNIIDRAYETFAGVQKAIGQPAPDEVSFVGGFIACFGILTGRVDIGLDQDAPMDKIMDAIHKDIHSFGQRIAESQMKQEQQERFQAQMSKAVRDAARRRN